jgi:hypothetical protein
MIFSMMDILTPCPFFMLYVPPVSVHDRNFGGLAPAPVVTAF